MPPRPYRSATESVTGAVRALGRGRRVVGVAHALAAGGTAALLLVGAWVAYGNLRRIAENDRRVAHSHEVLEALGDVAATLTLAESGARGYLVAGDPVYLEPYRQAVATIEPKLRRVRSLVRGEPARRARSPVLERMVQARLQELERTIRLRQSGFEAAREEMTTDVGRATMNAIRDEIAERVRLERAVLDERERESARSYRIAISNGLLVLALGLALIVALSVFVRRDLRARARIAERLREADRRKDEFLATLAHELRNPLGPLRTAVETLRLSGERRTAALHAQDVITRQVATMSRLVDDLLDVGRITSGVLELRREPLDLGLLVRQTAEACEPLVQAASHRLLLTLPEKPVWVSADATRLTQIFTNLLTNAVKYTPQGGTIELSVQAASTRAYVRVRDDGIGIPQEMLPRIFDMYTQVESASFRSQGGLGIGLALARRLLAMQDASIEARSAGMGKGSEFTVRLPRAATPSGEPAPAPAPRERRDAPRPRFRRRILVVDDSADAADSLAVFLGMLGHDVRIAEDGPTALSILSEFAPEIVLLDISLPGMSGYDVARAIREDPANAGVVLVAQTGWAREEDRRRSAEAGFDHHLTKPLDPRALESLIGSLES